MRTRNVEPIPGLAPPDSRAPKRDRRAAARRGNLRSFLASDRTRPTLTSARRTPRSELVSALSNDHHTMLAASTYPRAYIDACNAQRRSTRATAMLTSVPKKSCNAKIQQPRRRPRHAVRHSATSWPRKVNFIIGHRARSSASQPSASLGAAAPSTRSARAERDAEGSDGARRGA
jgi:hypothetical protein